MIKQIQKWLDLGDGWTAQVNLNYDDKTLEVRSMIRKNIKDLQEVIRYIDLED